MVRLKDLAVLKDVPDGVWLGVLSGSSGLELFPGGLEAVYKVPLVGLAVYLAPSDVLHLKAVVGEPGGAGTPVKRAVAPMKGAV